MSVSSPVPVMSPRLPVGSTAVIYCEGQFGEQDGKTAKEDNRFLRITEGSKLVDNGLALLV